MNSNQKHLSKLEIVYEGNIQFWSGSSDPYLVVDITPETTYRELKDLFYDAYNAADSEFFPDVSDSCFREFGKRLDELGEEKIFNLNVEIDEDFEYCLVIQLV